MTLLFAQPYGRHSALKEPEVDSPLRATEAVKVRSRTVNASRGALYDFSQSGSGSARYPKCRNRWATRVAGLHGAVAATAVQRDAVSGLCMASYAELVGE
jgi:hypothetical protein